ncbi:hypothetical protein CDAR_441341 [Caerostris darwini]|uniref:Uncharacterized protein n=1 Tax=Caerostris darwini TaxID=1538125 RepID=A0AAV4TQZ6_9ARAC|nr:hypothetical protein CDAR_441341 [Caerostris darwini]
MEKRRQEEPNEGSFGAKIRCAPVALQMKKGVRSRLESVRSSGSDNWFERRKSPQKEAFFPTPPARPPASPFKQLFFFPFNRVYCTAGRLPHHRTVVRRKGECEKKRWLNTLAYILHA